MRIDSLLTGLFVIAFGCAFAALFAFAFRSRRYQEETIRAYLRSVRREVTSEAVERHLPGLRVGAVLGIVASVIVVALGIFVVIESLL